MSKPARLGKVNDDLSDDQLKISVKSLLLIFLIVIIFFMAAILLQPQTYGFL